MLLLFALRRPNILPVGDLGVQRGMVLFWASGPEGPPVTSKKARPPSPEPNPTTADAQGTVIAADEAAMKQREEAHKVEDAVESSEHHVARSNGTASTTTTSHSTAAVGATSLPEPPALPADAKLTLAQLNTRKSGQKAKGNVYLT